VRRTVLEKGQSGGSANDMGESPKKIMEWRGHTKAVTFMCFTHEDENLVTTSSDCTVKVWNLADARLLHELVDSSLVISALPLMKPVGGFVVANTNAVLRIVVDGNMLQKVRLDHYARSLTTALDGTRLLAGTSRGWIHAFNLDDGKLVLATKMQMSRAAITCLLVVNCTDGTPPLVVANSMDSTVCVLQGNAGLTNFTVLRRIANPHKLLPLRSCHIPSANHGIGSGFVVSGSEDALVRAYDMDTFGECTLEAHSVPVVDVALTPDSTLMASGDVRGKLVLWRRGIS